MSEKIKEPPKGCMEIPGYILIVKENSWFTIDGRVTTNFSERGVWATYEESEQARHEFCI